MARNGRDVEINLIGNDHTGNATRSAGNNLDQLARKVEKFSADNKKSFKRSGLDAAQAFAASFLNAATFGKMGNNMATKLAPEFAAMGTRVGGIAAIGLGAALISKLNTYLTALAPLAIGALGIIPTIFLAKTDKQVQKHLQSLKAHAKAAMQDWSKPFKPGLLKAIEIIESKMKNLDAPVSRLFKAIGDSLPQLASGAMDALTNFLDALGTDSVKAGLKEWGKQLPGIGRAMGKLVDAILQDPEKTVSTVKEMASDLKSLASAGATIANGLSQITTAYGKMAAAIDKSEKKTFQKGGKESLFGISGESVHQWSVKVLHALEGMPGKIKAWASRVWSGAKSSFKRDMGQVANDVKNFVTKAVGFLRGLPGKAGSAISGLANSISTRVNTARTRAVNAIQNLVSRVVAFLRGLPGKAGSAVSGLWGRMVGAFNRATSGARSAAGRLVTGAVSFLRQLPGRAAGAVAGLWGRMAGAFSRAAGAARGAASRIVSAVVGIFRGLPGMVAGAIAGLAGVVSRAISGAVGAASRGIGAVRSALHLSGGEGGFQFALAGGGGGYRTGGPNVTLGDTNVHTRVFIGERELTPLIRSIVVDENSKAAHRAQTGRR